MSSIGSYDAEQWLSSKYEICLLDRPFIVAIGAYVLYARMHLAKNCSLSFGNFAEIIEPYTFIQ